jgi:hypothetical protein
VAWSGHADANAPTGAWHDTRSAVCPCRHADVYARAAQYGRPAADTDANHAWADQDAYRFSGPGRQSGGYPDANVNTNRYPDFDADTDADINFDPDSDADSDGYSTAYVYARFDGDADANSHGH